MALLIRSAYYKRGLLQFISHLNIMDTMRRTALRAGIPIAFSQGFSPHARIAPGPPLSIGIETEEEWIDFEMTKKYPAEIFMKVMNRKLPEDMRFTSAFTLEGKQQSLSSLITFGRYEFSLQGWEVPEDLFDKEIIIRKKAKKGKKERIVVVNEHTTGFTKTSNHSFEVLLPCSQTVTVNPLHLLQSLAETYGFSYPDDVVRIRRQKLFTGSKNSPLGLSEFFTQKPVS